MRVWQQPLPAIYTQLSEPELRLRIQLAKEPLGPKLVILGPPLSAGCGHRVRRLHRRQLRALPQGRRAEGRRVRRLLRRALHGRVAPTSSPPNTSA